MSRIGNSPILIPEGVNVQISPDEVIVSGKLGTLNQSYDCVTVEQKENEIIVSRDKDNNEHKSQTNQGSESKERQVGGTNEQTQKNDS